MSASRIKAVLQSCRSRRWHTLKIAYPLQGISNAVISCQGHYIFLLYSGRALHDFRRCLIEDIIQRLEDTSGTINLHQSVNVIQEAKFSTYGSDHFKYGYDKEGRVDWRHDK